LFLSVQDDGNCGRRIHDLIYDTSTSKSKLLPNVSSIEHKNPINSDSEVSKTIPLIE